MCFLRQPDRGASRERAARLLVEPEWAEPALAAGDDLQIAESNSRPPAMVMVTLAELRMFSSGLASRMTRSASFPGSRLPRSLSRPSARAGLIVAVRARHGCSFRQARTTKCPNARRAPRAGRGRRSRPERRARRSAGRRWRSTAGCPLRPGTSPAGGRGRRSSAAASSARGSVPSRPWFSGTTNSRRTAPP